MYGELEPYFCFVIGFLTYSKILNIKGIHRNPQDFTTAECSGEASHSHLWCSLYRGNEMWPRSAF